MADNLVTARREGRDQIRRFVTKRGIQEDGRGKTVGLKEIEQPPGPDPVSVVAPGKIEHVGFPQTRRQLRAQALAEGKRLEVEGDIDGEPFLVRPIVDRPFGQRAVAVTVVSG